MWFLLLLACADPPDPCARMCDAAAALYGGCLEEWGVGWDAAGFADENGFLGACETWSWEMRMLAEEAGEEVEGTCEARATALSAEDATCATYTEIDWNTPPWKLE